MAQPARAAHSIPFPFLSHLLVHAPEPRSHHSFLVPSCLSFVLAAAVCAVPVGPGGYPAGMVAYPPPGPGQYPPPGAYYAVPVGTQGVAPRRQGCNRKVFIAVAVGAAALLAVILVVRVVVRYYWS